MRYALKFSGKLSVQRKEWQLRIADMIGAIAEIQEFVAELDATSFQADRKTLRAVEYNFIILGEAARSVPEDIKRQFPGVP